MLLDFWQIKDELQLIALAVAIVLGLWRGAPPERACALVYLAMWLVDRGYHLLVGEIRVLGGADFGHIVIDGLTAFSLVIIALYANRNYTLWLASLQLVALFSHFLRVVSPSIDPTAYALLMASPMYLAVIVFATGVLRHIRRIRRYGPYRSWRASWLHNSGPSLPKPAQSV